MIDLNIPAFVDAFLKDPQITAILYMKYPNYLYSSDNINLFNLDDFKFGN